MNEDRYSSDGKIHDSQRLKELQTLPLWKPSTERMPYRCAELFCVKCDKSMGIQDIVTTNLETLMYCSECGDNHINYKYDKYLKPIVVTFGKSQCNSELIEVENE